MKDTNMPSPKQIRCIAIATQARLAPDALLAQRASSAAGMMFTLTGIFILIGGYEFQRARTVQRLNQLEREIESLKGRGISAA